MKKTYIYKYTTKDGKFLGYHYDSFCTIGMSCIEAKRYPMFEYVIAEQTNIIQRNFNTLCDKFTLGKFHGYPKEDIIISHEELAPQIEENHPETGFFCLIPIS